MLTTIIVAIIAFAAGLGAAVILKPKYPSTVAELEVLVAGATAKAADLKAKYTTTAPEKVVPATSSAVAAEVAKVQS